MESEHLAFLLIGLAVGLFLAAVHQTWIDWRLSKDRRRLERILDRSRRAQW